MYSDLVDDVCVLKKHAAAGSNATAYSVPGAPPQSTTVPGWSRGVTGTPSAAIDAGKYGSVQSEKSERTGGGVIFATLFVFALFLAGIGAVIWYTMKQKGARSFGAGDSRSFPNPVYDVTMISEPHAAVDNGAPAGASATVVVTEDAHC